MRTLTSFVCTALIALVSVSVSAREWSVVRIGVEGAYPPFSSVTADGRLVGFDIDIAEALCARIGARCPLVQQDWDGMLPALLARKFDAIIASMSITEERKRKVAFTNRYYRTPARFARRKGSGLEITAAGLAGKVVGVQRATTHDNFVTAKFGTAVRIKRYATQDEAYLDAVAGRLDLLLADAVAMEVGFIGTEQGKGWELVGPAYTDVEFFGEGIGIALRKEDDDLRRRLNAAIDAIRRDGTYRKINAKYFDFDVYGD